MGPKSIEWRRLEALPMMKASVYAVRPPRFRAVADRVERNYRRMRRRFPGGRGKNFEQAARAAHDCTQGVEPTLRSVAGQAGICKLAGHRCVRKCSNPTPRRTIRLYAEQVGKWRCVSFGMAAIGTGRNPR